MLPQNTSQLHQFQFHCTHCVVKLRYFQQLHCFTVFLCAYFLLFETERRNFFTILVVFFICVFFVVVNSCALSVANL